MQTYDAVVVGAGLAGLRAARDLSDQGRSVVVLESRDRLGGRAYTSQLGGRPVELGGSWFTPEQSQIRSELDRYGIWVRNYAPVEHSRWFTAGELRLGLPVPWQELGELERALVQISGDAAEVASGDESVGDESAWDYLEHLRPPPAVRDFLLGWWQLMGGAPPQTGAVIDALGAIANHGGLTGLLTCLAHGPAGGWARLADALAQSPGIDVRLSTPVRSVRCDDASVIARLADGTSVEGCAMVMAVPLNCLSDVEFVPALPERVSASFGANAGAAIKVVMLVRGVAPHGLAVGMAEGFKWLYVDDALDGDVILTGFTWPGSTFDPTSRADVEASLRCYFPEAELIDHAFHDWIGDSWSRGTWLTARPGAVHLLDPQRFSPVGRLVFAGSDVAVEHAGWFEGALRSGASAAEQVSALLDP